SCRARVALELCPSSYPRVQRRLRRLPPSPAAGVRSMALNRIPLPSNGSRDRLRDAERARLNRAEIVRELSWGRVSRRDLMKWGLFSAGGALARKRGLHPLGSASAQTGG